MERKRNIYLRLFLPFSEFMFFVNGRISRFNFKSMGVGNNSIAVAFAEPYCPFEQQEVPASSRLPSSI
jgi:hypothetical protein